MSARCTPTCVSYYGTLAASGWSLMADDSGFHLGCCGILFGEQRQCIYSTMIAP